MAASFRLVKYYDLPRIMMITGWWFGTFGWFSISYMGCHPSHWRSYFSRLLKPPTRLCMIMWDLMGVWPSGKLFCYGVDGLNFEIDDEFLFKNGDCIVQWLSGKINRLTLKFWQFLVVLVIFQHIPTPNSWQGHMGRYQNCSSFFPQGFLMIWYDMIWSKEV